MNSKVRFAIIFSFFVVGLGIWLLVVNALDPPYVSPVQSVPAASSKPTPVASDSATLGVKEEGVLVTEVVDGDTFKLETGETVRMVGIDTPETVDPRRPVGCFGKEASNETKSLLLGKRVVLQKDVTDKDKYDRILRLIYLPLDDGSLLFVNDYLVRDGFAKVYTYPPDIKFDERFKKAEIEAKNNKKGMWGKCVKLEI